MLREGLGTDVAVLVVEGVSDKAIFRSLCTMPQQILVADGKDKLLKAYRATKSEDCSNIVFVVDCDGDVARGTPPLRGSANLVITRYNDVEADLLALGVLSSAIAQVLGPAKVETDDEVRRATEDIHARATALAIPLGRVRRAARLAQISLDHLNRDRYKIDFLGVESDEPSRAIEWALTTAQRVGQLHQNQARTIRQRVVEVPSGYDVCNGHDLVFAVRSVLIEDHRVAKRKLESLDEMLRMGVDRARCSKWGVTRRLEHWQAANGRTLLRES
jgi:hypothetical protein